MTYRDHRRSGGLSRVLPGGLILALAFGQVAVGQNTESRCVPVKPWATLEDPVRLCAYLTDDDAAAACEARGFRLGEGVDENEARMALQTLLLCQHEFVIGVERETAHGEDVRRLAVTTAILREDDLASGYYDHGMVRVLAGRQGIWTEESVTPWSE